MSRLRRYAPLLLSGLILGMAGCATPPREPEALAAYKANNDPLEPLNRKIFTFNQAIDRAVLKPIAKGYVRVIPRPGRMGIRNLLINLHEPVVLTNNLLQGEFKRAGTTLGRFIVNSTIGLAGVMDIASRHDLPRQTGDFGQTLYVWGVREGPYLMLPIFGPSSPRDGLGTGADIFLDPYRTVLTFSRTVLGGVDERSRNIDSLDEIQREAVDFYASYRSLYRQNRAAQLRNGETVTTPPADLYDDPDNPKSAPPAH
jgi:phospholipid-binding lipoprotein MlaA